MMKRAMQILKDQRGALSTTEIMVLIAITAVIAAGVGAALKGSLTTGANTTGNFITNKFSAAQTN